IREERGGRSPGVSLNLQSPNVIIPDWVRKVSQTAGFFNIGLTLKAALMYDSRNLIKLEELWAKSKTSGARASAAVTRSSTLRRLSPAHRFSAPRKIPIRFGIIIDSLV